MTSDRETRARDYHREVDDGSTWDLLSEEQRNCYRQAADRLFAAWGMAPVVPTPAMIAAAWDAWSPRHKPHNKLGPGPAFREAIQAALAAKAAKAAPLPQTRSENTGGRGA